MEYLIGGLGLLVVAASVCGLILASLARAVATAAVDAQARRARRAFL